MIVWKCVSVIAWVKVKYVGVATLIDSITMCMCVCVWVGG